MPLQRIEAGNWPHPARLPLGCGWSGHCTAPGHDGDIPPQDILEAFCNLGYASSCTWAPAERIWDAVRFSVSVPQQEESDHDGGERPGPSRMLRLLYVCERDHRPITHGDLLVDVSTVTWLRRHHDERIQKMAECFLDSYLKKTPQSNL